jgi:hypothetical protein
MAGSFYTGGGDGRLGRATRRIKFNRLMTAGTNLKK